jgi:hypothetical protein
MMLTSATDVATGLDVLGVIKRWVGVGKGRTIAPKFAHVTTLNASRPTKEVARARRR